MDDAPKAGRATAEDTVGGALDYLLGRSADRESVCDWPPDVFAVVGFLLHRSGAYSRLVRSWPPKRVGRDRAAILKWMQDLRDVATQWRTAVNAGDAAPSLIRTLWHKVLNAGRRRLPDITENEDLSNALLLLCALADEACVGVGVPPEQDYLEYEAASLLYEQRENGSTLCKRVFKAHVRVLPKLHTPQNGLSVRSLSHHIALCTGGDLQLKWQSFPIQEKTLTHLNLLLVPWPFEIGTWQFVPAQPDFGELATMPAEYGFFEYRGAPEPSGVDRVVADLLKKATAECGRIHGVVLPELALRPSERDVVTRIVAKAGAFLMAGVSEQAVGEKAGRNYVVVDFPTGQEGYVVSAEQDKHHRWRLDGRQIRQYDLAYALAPRRSWWEFSEMRDRQLNFFAIDRWLTICPLICEDLARQDPVADAVRSVGPNLIVALLMDGPQLAGRWPARYATVFADDPGSSVLTLTSLGMAGRSRPAGGQPGSRRIALWKDARSGTVEEIECPPGAEGVVLCLTEETGEEWTADGRSDGRTARYPVLSSQRPVTR